MNALISSAKTISFKNLPSPKITRDHQVKIRIKRAALCRTDLYVADGRIPVDDGLILGHEAAGEIIQAGDLVEHFQIGDRVVVDPLESCGSCHDCQTHRAHLCGETRFMGIDFHGAFAEEIVISANKVHRIPDDLDFDLAIYAEPLAATRAILGALDSPGDDILVYGQGRIAKLTEHVLKTAGFQNILTTISPPTKQFPVIIDAVDCAGKIADALPHLSPGGTLIVKSRHPEKASFPLLDLIKKRTQIKAVHYGTFDDALTHLTENRDFIRTLIGNQYPLESYREAFAEARSSEALKTLFNFD